MKKIFIVLTSTFLFSACKNNKEQKTSDQPIVLEQSDTVNNYSLIGKKAFLAYPEFKAEVSYLTDSTLHWKTIYPDGKIEHGDEKVFLKKINDHQYFLNWIEETGLSISQVIDVKAGTVTAFGTYADEKSLRGKRSSMNLEGTFEFVK